jgi:hypothetical protein
MAQKIKNRIGLMNTEYTTSKKLLYWGLLFFLGILSVSGTIALRNMLHVLLLGLLLWQIAIKPARNAYHFTDVFKAIPIALPIWITFLFVFPFLAVDKSTAWHSLGSNWIESILTWVLAFGVVIVLGQKGPSLFTLAVASAVPVFLHLFLSLFALGGLLTESFYQDPTLNSAAQSIADLFTGAKPWDWHWTSIMGFRGIEPMHGNIGYPECQAIALACGCVYQASITKDKSAFWKAIFLIGMCVLSAVMSSSRGAVYFSFLLLLGALVLSILVKNKTQQTQEIRTIQARWKLVSIVVLLFLATALTSFHLLKADPKWNSMWDKIQVGLMIKDPVGTLCNGLSQKNLDEIKHRYRDHNADYVENLVSGLGSDGGRALLLRAGSQLVAENPQGFDGSRQAFEKIMSKTCGHEPVYAFSHAHNAWINLALSIGWLGSALFLYLFMSFVREGFKNLKNPVSTPVSFALILVAVFWIFRGFADAVYQEQYLQMQAFVILYLLLRSRLLEFK